MRIDKCNPHHPHHYEPFSTFSLSKLLAIIILVNIDDHFHKHWCWPHLLCRLLTEQYVYAPKGHYCTVSYLLWGSKGRVLKNKMEIWNGIFLLASDPTPLNRHISIHLFTPLFFFCNWILLIWNGFYTWSQSKLSFFSPLISVTKKGI